MRRAVASFTGWTLHMHRRERSSHGRSLPVSGYGSVAGMIKTVMLIRGCLTGANASRRHAPHQQAQFQGAVRVWLPRSGRGPEAHRRGRRHDPYQGDYISEIQSMLVGLSSLLTALHCAVPHRNPDYPAVAVCTDTCIYTQNCMVARAAAAVRKAVLVSSSSSKAVKATAEQCVMRVYRLVCAGRGRHRQCG